MNIYSKLFLVLAFVACTDSKPTSVQVSRGLASEADDVTQANIEGEFEVGGYKQRRKLFEKIPTFGVRPNNGYFEFDKNKVSKCEIDYRDTQSISDPEDRSITMRFKFSVAATPFQLAGEERQIEEFVSPLVSSRYPITTGYKELEKIPVTQRREMYSFSNGWIVDEGVYKTEIRLKNGLTIVHKAHVSLKEGTIESIKGFEINFYKEPRKGVADDLSKLKPFAQFNCGLELTS